MYTIANDLSKRTSMFNVLSPDGTVFRKGKVMNSYQTIRSFVQSIPGPKRLAVEATRSWELLYETTSELVDEFLLGHPLKMKAISCANIKNDKVDAATIARLAYTNFLPKVFIPSSDIRQLRSILRCRAFLVNQRRGIRNQVHALIDRNIWALDRPKSFKDIFCKRGRLWLKGICLPEKERFILDEFLKIFDYLSAEITSIESVVSKYQANIPKLSILRSVPGFRKGNVHAYTVLLEIADIQRFHKAEGLLHYAGLIPREYSSGDKLRIGRLVKNANLVLRTALIESTFAAMRCDKQLKLYYQSVKERRGSAGPAVIATARKLCKIIFYMLKNNLAYQASLLEPKTPVTACHSSSKRLITA